MKRPTGKIAVLPRFVLLYALMYAAFGVASPFLPAFLVSQGVTPERLGLLLAAGTGVRLLTAPLAGRVGDRLGALRVVLAIFIALAAVAVLAYGPAHGFAALFAVSLSHAAALAPTTVLADALALALAASMPPAASERRGFQYGWVRGAGSAAFIVGNLVSGRAVGTFGLDAILGLQAVLLAVAAPAALRVPEPPSHRQPVSEVHTRIGGVALLLRLRAFRYLMIIAALILGSHAMHDAFAVIRWNAAGISPAAASLLWSESVAAEVLVFFIIGPALVAKLSPAGALTIAALAGVVRWITMATTSALPALLLVQPLHGFTFALQHLACMQVIARIVPRGLEGTAQGLYSTLGIGIPSALLTLASGLLYGRLGAAGFWAMAGLCALALPLIYRFLHLPDESSAALKHR